MSKPMGEDEVRDLQQLVEDGGNGKEIKYLGWMCEDWLRLREAAQAAAEALAQFPTIRKEGQAYLVAIGRPIDLELLFEATIALAQLAAVGVVPVTVEVG